MTVNQLEKDDGVLTENDQEAADVQGDFIRSVFMDQDRYTIPVFIREQMNAWFTFHS